MFTRRASLFALVILFLLLAVSHSFAQRITYKTREVLSGLNVPWEMRFAPDGWLFFTQRPGSFSKMNTETGEVKQLLAERVNLWNEAGMLGFDFHPNFPDSPYIYLAYVYGHPDVAYGVFRYRYTGDTLTDKLQIFGPAPGYHTHMGSRVLAHDDHLYFSYGEAWQFMIAQNPEVPSGKINRINFDGSIPFDNPFSHSSAWSIGHRNPQGLDFAPDGTLYSSEHGESTDDEINLIERGRNYGWPIVRGYCDSADEQIYCEDLSVREPLAAFTPTLAVGDIAYFDHPTFPEWQRSLILMTLKDQSLWQFRLSDDGRSILSRERYELVDGEGEPYGRLRSIALTKDGRIFISTSNGTSASTHPDRIFELIRTGVEPSSVTLKLPLPDTEITTGAVNLEWHPSFYQAKYEIQLSTNEDFSSPVVLMQDVHDSLIRTSLVANTRYYWRVRELTTSGPWSEVRSFKTASVLETPPASDSSLSFDMLTHARSIGIVAHSVISGAALEVFDVLGRRHLNMVLDDVSIGRERLLGQFEPGVYFVRVTNSNSSQTKRVLVR